jgi:hypothetical protein
VHFEKAGDIGGRDAVNLMEEAECTDQAELL